MTAVGRPPVIVANAKPPVQRKSKGPERNWTGREDEILISAVGKYAAGEKINWIKIAELIDGRSNKACRKRWIHSLNHTLRKGARRSPLSSQSSIAIQGDSGHQKHYCSCNTGLSMCQSLPEPVGKPDTHDAGLESSQKHHPPPASITPLDRASVTELLEQPLAARGTSQAQGPGHYFEFLIHALTSKIGRESLYALPIEAATVIIDGLEQGSRENSGLCRYHRERFSLTLRKMCSERRLLPSSYAVTDELQRIGVIPCGRGGTADVWRGVYRGSGVAVKVLRVYSRVDLARVEMNFCREVVLWKQFKHPNLVPLVGATKSPHTLMKVSDWMEHGTIMDFIAACPETNRLKLLADVARGLKYLHDWPSVHADLKSTNILIDSSHCARIADFGLTSVLRHPSVSISVTTPVWGGTPRWMAPELFNERSSPSRESDIYALGMVIYEVFAQEQPFSQVYPILVPLLVLDNRRPSRPQSREILGLSDDVWMLAERCWDGNPSVRPHIADILSHFEEASCHWVPLTSQTIANHGLDRPATRRPPTREQTLTMSEGASGDDRAGSGDRNVGAAGPRGAWRSLLMAILNGAGRLAAIMADLRSVLF